MRPISKFTKKFLFNKLEQKDYESLYDQFYNFAEDMSRQDLNEFYRDTMIENLKEEDFDYWFDCGGFLRKKCNELNSNCEC